MAGGNFILGGLLSGIGRGMEQDYLARREEALQRLRNQDTIDAENRREQATIRAEGRADTRKIDAEKRDYENDVGKLRVAGEIKSKDRADQFGYDVKLAKIKANEDRNTAGFKAKLDQDLATMKAELDKSTDEYSQRLKTQLASGKIKDRVTDANGRVILITNDGQMITTPFTEKDKVDTSMPYGKDRKRGPTPEGFDPKSRSASSNSDDGSPLYSPGASGGETRKVATAAQVRETARAQNMTEAQVRAWMQKNGWSIE